MEGGGRPYPKNPDKVKQKENKSRKQTFKYGNNFRITKKKKHTHKKRKQKQPKTKTIDKKKLKKKPRLFMFKKITRDKLQIKL